MKSDNKHTALEIINDFTKHFSSPLEEKKPRLFYYEEALNCFIPVTNNLEKTIDTVFSVEDLSDGEVIVINFKRIDMTDEEFNNLPED